MGRGASLVWVVALSLPAWGLAQEQLPPVLHGWQRTAYETVAAAQLENVAGGKAMLWREYGAVGAERATYEGNASRLTVVLYRMRDSAGAYGAFSFFGAGSPPASLGAEGRKTKSGWVFYQANVCVTAQGSSGRAPAEALSLLADRLTSEAAPRTSGLPSLLAFLPRTGLRQRSERYILGPAALSELAPIGKGDWLGFPYGVEAVWADYDLGGRPAGLLLASYPTPQLAAERLREFNESFNLNGTGNPVLPLVYAKRAGPLVGLLTGVDSGTLAGGVLNQLRYEFSVSWDESTKKPTASDWTRTLANIFIGTGLMILYALLCGLLFGGLRVLVQRLFPGKVFNRPGETEIIQLNLGGR